MDHNISKYSSWEREGAEERFLHRYKAHVPLFCCAEFRSDCIQSRGVARVAMRAYKSSLEMPKMSYVPYMDH